MTGDYIILANDQYYGCDECNDVATVLHGDGSFLCSLCLEVRS